MKDVMIDIETLGTSPGAPVIQVAAVAFDFHSSVKFEFACYIDSIDDFKVNSDTLKWWLKENPQLLLEIVERGKDLNYFDFFFNQWFDEHVSPNAKIWANGASFDFPLIKTHLQSIPWKYYHERDYRTVIAIAQTMGFERFPFQGVKHNALDDCHHQVRELQRAMKIINGEVTCSSKLSTASSIHASLSSSQT